MIATRRLVLDANIRLRGVFGVRVGYLLDAPIWTEDQDFFGSGIATWTSDRIEQYLGEE